MKFNSPDLKVEPIIYFRGRADNQYTLVLPVKSEVYTPKYIMKNHVMMYKNDTNCCS